MSQEISSRNHDAGCESIDSIAYGRIMISFVIARRWFWPV